MNLNSQRYRKLTITSSTVVLIATTLIFFQNCGEQVGFYANEYESVSALAPNSPNLSNANTNTNTNANPDSNTNSRNNSGNTTLSGTTQTTNSTQNNTNASNTTNTTLPTPVLKTNIQYFGYFSNPVSGDYMDEVSDHTNFVVTDPTQYTSDSFRDLLTKAKNKQMKIIISVSNIFYKLEGLNLTFRTDLWQQVAADITAMNALDVVLSFYFDEPELAVDAIKEMARQQNTSVNLDYLTEMNRVASAVRANFPNAKMQMTSAYVHVNPSMVLPSSFDYFAFDCYSGWDACGDSTHSLTIPQYFQILKQKVEALNQQDGKSRRIFLIPPTFVESNSTSTYESTAESTTGAQTEKLVLNLFPKYIELALANSIVIGVMPFLWQDLHENSKLFIGARSNSTIKGVVRNYGRQILNR